MNRIGTIALVMGLLCSPYVVDAKLVTGEIVGSVSSYEDENNYLGFGPTGDHAISIFGPGIGAELKAEFTIDLDATPSDSDPDSSVGLYETRGTDWLNINWSIDDETIYLPPLYLVPPSSDPFAEVEEKVEVRDRAVSNSIPRDGLRLWEYETSRFFIDSPTEAHRLSKTSQITLNTQYGFIYSDSLGALDFDYKAARDSSSSPDPYYLLEYIYTHEFYTFDANTLRWWLTDHDDILHVIATIDAATASVPEPSSILLIGLGVVGLGLQVKHCNRLQAC